MSRALSILLFALCLRVATAETFTVGTYNLEMYIDVPALNHEPKSEESKQKVRESIKAMGADVIAVEEMGGVAAFEELRSSLGHDGLQYPHFAHVGGADTNLHVAVLSKFPIVRKTFHTKESYLLHGRRHHVARGFGQFEIEVLPNYHFTILVAHLKSKRVAFEADEAEMREQEAIILRDHIDELLNENPRLNLVVAGDLNDTKDSPSTRAILGKGKNALIDTRPAEQNGDAGGHFTRGDASRTITWTHYFAREDLYSRIDYILISKTMSRAWEHTGTHVVTIPNWGIASDHRPIVARFHTEDR